MTPVLTILERELGKVGGRAGLVKIREIKFKRTPKNIQHLSYHMYTKLKMGNTVMCTCGQAPQTAKHIL
jgi:hypothetical protein